MDKTTKAFVIAAWCVVIGAGIAVPAYLWQKDQNEKAAQIKAEKEEAQLDDEDRGEGMVIQRLDPAIHPPPSHAAPLSPRELENVEVWVTHPPPATPAPSVPAAAGSILSGVLNSENTGGAEESADAHGDPGGVRDQDGDASCTPQAGSDEEGERSCGPSKEVNEEMEETADEPAAVLEAEARDNDKDERPVAAMNEVVEGVSGCVVAGENAIVSPPAERKLSGRSPAERLAIIENARLRATVDAYERCVVDLEEQCAACASAVEELVRQIAASVAIE